MPTLLVVMTDLRTNRYALHLRFAPGRTSRSVWAAPLVALALLLQLAIPPSASACHTQSPTGEMSCPACIEQSQATNRPSCHGEPDEATSCPDRGVPGSCCDLAKSDSLPATKEIRQGLVPVPVADPEMLEDCGSSCPEPCNSEYRIQSDTLQRSTGPPALYLVSFLRL